ncbi:MAG: hypothetical protein WBB25_11840 [Sulfitobacter sp.]
MNDRSNTNDGPFRASDTKNRQDLDADSKAFLDVARFEAEGYTDEKLETALGSWDADRLDQLERTLQSDSFAQTAIANLRRLVIGGLAALALLLVGLGIWVNSGFESAQSALDARTGAVESALSQRVDDLQVAMDSKVIGADGKALRVVTGRVCPEQVKWTACTSGCGARAPTSGNLLVDTSVAGFKSTPNYYVSITGSGAWIADGLDSIYSATAEGFKLYVRREDGANLPSSANGKANWCIRWMGIGE